MSASKLEFVSMSRIVKKVEPLVVLSCYKGAYIHNNIICTI